MMRTAAAAAFLLPAVLAIQKRKACPDLDLRCRTELGAVVNCLEQDTSPTDTSDIINATLATCITENNFACPTCNRCPLSYRCNDPAKPADFIKQTKRFEDFKNRIENEKGADELAVCSDALKTCLTTDSTTCQSAFDSCKAAAVSSMEGCGDDGDDVQCAQNVQDGAAREGLDLLKTCLNTTAAGSTRKKTVRECQNGAEIRDALKERTGYQNISDSQAEALLRQGELDDFSSGLSDCRLQFDTAQSRRSCEIEKAKEFNPNITDIELGELRQELGKKRAAQGMKGCREQGGSNCFADASTVSYLHPALLVST